MLQDYRNYIINLRNGLIQCGVDVSISPLASYRELFYEADKLSQILWFYSIMEVSGSPLALDGFFIDLGRYYREEMRQRYYAEFQDYLDGYKRISKLAYLAGEEPKDYLGTTPEDEFDADEEFDIFGTDESEVSGTFVESVGVDEIEDTEFEEVHGVFLEDVDFYYNVDKVLGTGYIPSEISVQLEYQDETLEVHGTFIDEISTESIHDSYI
ncbi:MAG: hypothetical protein IKL53_11045, partial [Lachnospiraceae bacterium]|nr:hypothetical protein [Lachnospiraceae bacterium]